MTSAETLERIAAILEREHEADDALRSVVETLAGATGVTWAAIAFLEGGEPVVGPEAGIPDESRRSRVSIAFGGEPVGDLLVDGVADPAVLEKVAELLSPYVLIGWDTDGEAWEP